MKKIFIALIFALTVSACSKEKVDPDLTTSFIGTWKTTQIDGDYKNDYVFNFNRLTNNSVKINITNIEQFKKETPVTTVTILESVKVLDNRTLDFNLTNSGVKMSGTGVLTNSKLSISLTTIDGDSYWELTKQ